MNKDQNRPSRALHAACAVAFQVLSRIVVLIFGLDLTIWESMAVALVAGLAGVATATSIHEYRALRYK